MKRNIRTTISEFMGRHRGAAMALCCIVPIAIIAALSLGGIAGRAGGRSLSLVVSLLCPLSMIGMMIFMGKDHNHGNGKEAAGPACHTSTEETIDITNDPNRKGGAKRW